MTSPPLRSCETFLLVVVPRVFAESSCLFFLSYAQLVAANKPTNADADLKAAFEAMDSDKTGKISKKMLKHFLTSVGEKLSVAEADALLKECPDNVDFPAFKKAVLGQ